MVRKVLVVLSSLTVVALVGVAVSAPAYAGGSKVDARGYSASCSDVTGSVKWSPPLHWSGSAGDFTVKLKLTLSGCTATPTEGGTPVDITKGVATGSVTGSNVGCSGLFGTSADNTGTVKVKWTTSPKLSSGDTVVHVNSTTAGYLPNGDGFFKVPGSIPPTGSGSFSGDNGGAANSLLGDVGPATAIYDACNSTKGLKTSDAVSGTASFGGVGCVNGTSGSTVWAWGDNAQGQVGNGTETNQLCPEQVGTDTDWTQVSSGGGATFAVKSDGTLWAWGSGYLGNGSDTTSETPVQVGTDTDWSQVSGGGGFTVAIKQDGTLWAWGYNALGGLGDGTTTSQASPEQIGSATDWQQVSAGLDHVVALQTNGTLWSWGYNGQGQVGNGTTTEQNSPVQIGTATDWTDVTAGHFPGGSCPSGCLDFSLAVASNGTLWAWGDNSDGELGDGTTTNQLSPEQIGTGTDWSQVSGGDLSTVALQNNGTLWAWGNNSDGELGDGTTTNESSPEQIGTATDWTQVSAGQDFTMALQNNGTLWAWGNNSDGELGDGTTTNESSPEQIGTATDWTQVSAGFQGSSGIQYQPPED